MRCPSNLLCEFGLTCQFFRLQQLLLAWSLTKTLFLTVLGKDHHSDEDVAAGPIGSPGQAAVRLQQLLLAWSLTKTLFLTVLGKDHHSDEDVAAGPIGSPGQAAVRLQQLLLAWSLTKTFPTLSHPTMSSARHFSLVLTQPVQHCVETDYLQNQKCYCRYQQLVR